MRLAGWDLLPPGSKGYEFDNFTYAGYHQSPMKWAVGTTPVPIGWAAGIQYDGDTSRADAVLKDLQTYYPGATDYGECDHRSVSQNCVCISSDYRAAVFITNRGRRLLLVAR